MSGFLDHVASAPEVTVEELLGDRPLVVLAPHPDDETLGCGALLFDASAQGTPCHVICVTDGGRSHPNSHLWAAPRLARARKAELHDAVGILAPRAQVAWLGYPDCAAPDDGEAVQRVADLIPQQALLLSTWDGDPHIDHEQVARLAARVAAFRPDVSLMFYPVWGRFTDQVRPARLVQASPEAGEAKARALVCHRTQMSGLINDDPEGFVMQAAHQQHFLSHREIVIAP